MSGSPSIQPRRPRGRPAQVTLEAIVEAGIAISLPRLTIAAVAQSLGVTSVTIYNHVDGIESLRRLVAEEILRRREPSNPTGTDLKDDLLRHAVELREFVHAYPGIASYLAQINSDSTTGIAMISAHHAKYAETYRLSAVQASWLLSAVAEHALALAELVFVPGGRKRNRPERIVARPDLAHLASVVEAMPRYDDEYYFRWSMTATIIGLLELIKDLP